MMIHNLVKVRGADFCDDQFPIISTIGRGPKGEKGDKGDKGDTGNFAISYVGTWGAKENDDTISWQTIIDNIAEFSNTIDFGDGQWIINEQLEIPMNIKEIVGIGAVIKTTSSVDTLFNVIHGNPDYLTDRYIIKIHGISFFCNFNVSRVAYIGPSQAVISDCTFKDFKDVGAEFVSAGCVVRDSNFIISQNGDPFANDTIGCKVWTDSSVSGCKFFGLHVAIEVLDSCRISNNYFWINTLTNEAYCVYGKIGSNVPGVAFITFINNETDGYPYVFYDAAGIITNNFFVYNGSEIYLDDPWSIFVFEHSSQRSLNFSDNTIYFVNGYQHELHTFYGSHSYDGANEYVSSNNTMKNSRNETVSGFCVGFGSPTIRNINYNALNLFASTVVGINISYDEYFDSRALYRTSINDSGGNLQMTIANTQGSARHPLTPTLHKTQDDSLILTSLRRGGGFNNIVSRGVRALFEFCPIPENLGEATPTLTVTQYFMASE